MISAAFPQKKQRRKSLAVRWRTWRWEKAITCTAIQPHHTCGATRCPHLEPLGHCIAPDLIGMGYSDKLPESGSGSYRFVKHRRRPFRPGIFA
jgi:haloalkane dehalogenase